MIAEHVGVVRSRAARPSSSPIVIEKKAAVEAVMPNVRRLSAKIKRKATLGRIQV
jgi:hypothetical protein